MYYKVMFNGKVIDILDKLIFVKYQQKHNRMVLCTEDEAQGILSSDKSKIWHEVSMYNIPIPGYDTVRLYPIDKYEYEQLKILGGKTPQEIIDAYTLSILSLIGGM